MTCNTILIKVVSQTGSIDVAYSDNLDLYNITSFQRQL